MAQIRNWWLLKFEDHSKKLLINVESFLYWLANQNPPWDAYKAFMFGHLISLEKLTGVCPVGAGEIWCPLFAKCVLNVTGSRATHACRDDHICAWLKTGIDMVLHGVQYICEANSTKEKKVF